MNLFSRLKKSDGEARFKHNNKSILIGSNKGLFDDIVGFEDVKSLFEMAIKAERPVHLLLCGPPSSGKSLLMSSLPNLKGHTMQLEAVLQSQEYLIICLSIGHAISLLMNLKK
jgi:predicted ATPase with chaperone activity